MVAVAGTVALTLVAVLLRSELAGEPLKLTPVVAESPVPVIVTVVAATACAGLKLVSFGSTWKLVALAVDPPAFVTVIGPLMALAGAVTLSWVLLRTVKGAGALTEPNVTLVVPANVLPVIVKLVPATPLVWPRVVIVGAIGSLSGLLVPPGPVAVRLLVRALSASVRWRWVASSTTKGTLAAPSLTTETSARFEPVTVIVSPAWAGLGAVLVRLGTGLKLAVLVALPPGGVTTIWRMVALAGTVALTLVAVLLRSELAGEPLKLTPVVAESPVPVIVTVVAATACAGLKLVSFGS